VQKIHQHSEQTLPVKQGKRAPTSIIGALSALSALGLMAEELLTPIATL
jgi:capsular polysaccharide export protein